ncbi:hypothetical protein VPH35_002532 [Triticum aestivum]
MIRTENSENFKDKINEVTGVMAAVYGGDPSRRTPQAICICPTREIVLMQVDMFLTKLTSICKRSTEKGSMWVTMKRLSMKCQARLKKMASKGEPVEYRCLVCATDGKRNISTSVLFTFSLLLVRHYVCWMLPLFSPLVCYDLNYRSNICIFPSCIYCMN